MRADFSRWSFDLLKSYRKHYAGVLHQQGRVWLDADWNEDVLTRLQLLQQETRDIVGGCGTPKPGTAFQISPHPQVPENFLIGGGAGRRGRYYVHGILAQLDETTAYTAQPDLPDPISPVSPEDIRAGQEQYGVVYLEVWRRLITYLEDSSLREIALGGPDTTTRLKTVAQVKVAKWNGDVEPTCATAHTALPHKGAGTLSTLDKQVPAAPPDPCRLPGSVAYTGTQNRLYRVEIHESGDLFDGGGHPIRIKLAKNADATETELTLATPLSEDEVNALKRTGAVTICDNEHEEEAELQKVEGVTVTLKNGLLSTFLTSKNAVLVGNAARFKWSRDNAAFAVGVTKVAGKVLTVTNLGRDETTILKENDLVEISDDTRELRDNHGVLRRLAKDLNRDELTIELDYPLPKELIKGDVQARHMVLRRWDGCGWGSAAPDNALPPDHNLKDGVRIRFGGSDLRAGDFWQFATRVADNSVELLDNAEPMGIRRFRCPLAIVRWSKKPRWDRETVLSVFSENQILSDEAAEAELNAQPESLFEEHDVVRIARNAHATEEKRAALPNLLNAADAVRPDEVHFHVDHDCRNIFLPLIDLAPWLMLKYVGGDGQEAALDGKLGQPLQVAVFKGSKPVAGARVQFKRITTQKGSLNPPTAITDNNGIATCEWILGTEPDGGDPFPPRSQQVEATLLDSPNQEPPIRFNANLSLMRFCYVGGDGQEAGKENKLPKPLEVAVFNGYAPVPKRKVRFSILDDFGGELTGVDAGGVTVHDSEIVVETDKDGLAYCTWALDPDYPGQAQTVAARVLDDRNDAFLQPIHFNATSEQEIVFRIDKISFAKNDDSNLVNDGMYWPLQLKKGLEFHLDQELEDLQIVSRATCYLTVEVPLSVLVGEFPDPKKTPLMPLVLAAENVELVGKNRIWWQPTDATVKLLQRWTANDNVDRLLTRVYLLGNFLYSSDETSMFYLDGDSYGRDAIPGNLWLPTGDGRAGGDFRMWFWLQRSNLKVDKTIVDFGGVVTNVADGIPAALKVTGPDGHVLKLEIDQVENGPFSLGPTGPIPLVPAEGATVNMKFKPNSVGPVHGTLKITDQDTGDVTEVELTGNGVSPA